MKRIREFVWGMVIGVISMPYLLHAQERQPSVQGPTREPNNGGFGVQLQNPLKSDTLMGFFNDLLEVVMVFAIPLIVFFIILAGFQYVMARGNPGKIATANMSLLFAVIGGVLILGAWVILEVISGTVDALGS